MIQSIRTSQSLKSLRSVCLLSTVALGVVGGCADVVTYSKDSRREGIELYNRQAYADAAGAFRNAVRQNPRDYRSYYYLGAANEQLGQYQQALAAYKTSYQVIDTTMEGKQDPEFRYRVLNGWASAIATGDNTDVELNAIELRARTRGQTDDNYILARVYAQRGDHDSAIEAYERAVNIDPNNFHYVREAGLYLESISQQQRAIPLLKRAYSLDNTDTQVTAALSRLNIVPGPSLKAESQLARPLVPKGPIPELPLYNTGGLSNTNEPTIHD
ncbi:MAG TPA: tetratricopeptide repeat protein [Tepidisphaeraceae bacterium]|nr:tetratricopeptide repeat protein [Tepidisphaeraceae bacterium]